MEHNTYICTLFYAEQENEESLYPNLGNSYKSSSFEFQEIYWRSILVFFSSSYRYNPNAKHILFSNTTPPKKEWKDLLSKLGVQIINIDYKHKPPKGYWSQWQSTFYIIDCLNYLKDYISDDDVVLILDLDCIWVGPVTDLERQIREDGITNYCIDYPEDHVVHQLTRRDFQVIFSDLSGISAEFPPNYYGGEFYAFSGKENALILYEEAHKAMKASISRSQKNLPKFNTEEHLFSYIFWKLGIENGNANKYIKRIWTSPIYRNVENSDLELLIWHLPREKKYGIKRLSNYVLMENSLFWSIDIDKLKTYIGKFMGIPKRNFYRFMLDTLAKPVINIKRIIKK